MRCRRRKLGNSRTSQKHCLLARMTRKLPATPKAPRARHAASPQSTAARHVTLDPAAWPVFARTKRRLAARGSARASQASTQGMAFHRTSCFEVMLRELFALATRRGLLVTMLSIASFTQQIIRAFCSLCSCVCVFVCGCGCVWLCIACLCWRAHVCRLLLLDFRLLEEAHRLVGSAKRGPHSAQPPTKHAVGCHD